MKKLLSFALTLLLSPNLWATSRDVFEETLYQNFKDQIASKELSKSAIIGLPAEQSLFIDALWDLTEENHSVALKTLKELPSFHYNTTEKLRLEILRLKHLYSTKLPTFLIDELMSSLRVPEAETRLIYTLATYEEELLNSGHHELIELAQLHEQYEHISLSEEKKRPVPDSVVSDLFHHSPDLSDYMDGKYKDGVKIFMFCRQNRLYPCLMVMRDLNDEVVREEDGTIWTHEALASSARDLPSHVRNGNTPAGIFTIDSVMPYADQRISFGKFRRMILNFIPKSKNESNIKALLPLSSHQESWWRPTLLARDVGRNLFRIHGSGKLSLEPEAPYHPFIRTAGCIAQRENTYDGVHYKDQRELLDDIMQAMQLVPKFQNETKIKGVLYLMELDDTLAPVTIDDLLVRGIQ